MRLLYPSLVGLALLSACTTVPSAKVAGVQLEKQGAEGARVVAAVEFENKTATPMPMVAVTYRLTVEGAPAFEIDDQPFMTVPAKAAGQTGLQTVVLPAGIPSPVSLAGRKYVLDGTFTFEPDTDWRRLKTEVGVPLPTRDFHAEGVLGQAGSPVDSPKP